VAAHVNATGWLLVPLALCAPDAVPAGGACGGERRGKVLPTSLRSELELAKLGIGEPERGLELRVLVWHLPGQCTGKN